MHIDVEKGVFFSTYKKCTRKWLITRCVLNRIDYDFNDIEMRKKLKNMGFKLKVVR